MSVSKSALSKLVVLEIIPSTRVRATYNIEYLMLLFDRKHKCHSGYKNPFVIEDIFLVLHVGKPRKDNFVSL